MEWSGASVKKFRKPWFDGNERHNMKSCSQLLEGGGSKCILMISNYCNIGKTLQ